MSDRLSSPCRGALPVALFNGHREFAVEVTDDNMHPRHQVGKFVIVEIDDLAEPGDDVLLVHADGASRTWRLDAITDSELTVTGYNPPVTKTIARSEVREIYWASTCVDRKVVEHCKIVASTPNNNASRRICTAEESLQAGA